MHIPPPGIGLNYHRKFSTKTFRSSILLYTYFQTQVMLYCIYNLYCKERGLSGHSKHIVDNTIIDTAYLDVRYLYVKMWHLLQMIFLTKGI